MRRKSEDIIQTSLTELVLLLVFFLLVLLGSVTKTQAVYEPTPLLDLGQREGHEIDGELAALNHALSSDISILTSKYAALQNEIEEIEGRWSSTKQRAEMLSSDVKTLRRLNEKLDEELEHAAQSVVDKNKRLEIAKKKGRESDSRISQLTSEIEGLEEDLRKSEKNLSDYKRLTLTKYNALRQQSVKYKSERDVQIRATQVARADAQKAEKHISQAEKDIDSLKKGTGFWEKRSESLLGDVDELNKKFSGLEGSLEETETKYKNILTHNRRLIVENANLKTTQSKVTSWPPVLRLPDNKGFRFESGSFALSREFQNKLLLEVIPAINRLTSESNYPIDIIEIVGHTDEQPVGNKGSSVDENLIRFLDRNGIGTDLAVADNAGLGLARAVSVIVYLRRNSNLGQRFQLVPYSGGQVVELDNSLATGLVTKRPDRSRRRIEIRIRGRSRTLVPQ